MNVSVIFLIPKFSGLEFVKYFRLIVVSNFKFKIISKFFLIDSIL